MLTVEIRVKPGAARTAVGGEYDGRLVVMVQARDEAEAAEGFELPGADLSDEELQVTVLPAQSDEFTCASCFLVRHRSQVALEEDGMLYCTDCEG